MADEYESPFDELKGFDVDAAIAADDEARARGQHKDYLIHRVFAQTEEGRELLEIWHADRLIKVPVVRPDSTAFEAGIEQGLTNFVRGLILTIQKVERDD